MEIDRQIPGLIRLRKPLQSADGLLEPVYGLPVRRGGNGLQAGLPKICDRLAPRFATKRVVRQSFDVLAQPIRIEPLDRVHDLAVEIAPLVLEETAVGHVVSQSMLEGVLEVRKDA